MCGVGCWGCAFIVFIFGRCAYGMPGTGEPVGRGVGEGVGDGDSDGVGDWLGSGLGVGVAVGDGVGLGSCPRTANGEQSVVVIRMLKNRLRDRVRKVGAWRCMRVLLLNLPTVRANRKSGNWALG
jgi:hypothetical protein